MKKKVSVIISFIVIFSMILSSTVFAADEYELPPIAIVHEHSFTDWDITTEPTCTKEGMKTRHCRTCPVSETLIVPALGHDFGDWSETSPKVDADCTTAGSNAVETHTCSRCGTTETRGGEVINALGHDYVSDVTAPTCTEKGYTTYTCSRCNDSYKADFTDAKGHTPGEAQEENTVAAKCTVDGSYDEVIYCTDCQAEISRIKKTIPALGHDFGDWSETSPKVDADCTTAGSSAVETHTCSRCNTSETRGGEVINALGHDYVSAVTAPTCTEKGYTTYTCSRCDDSYKADFTDAKGHTPGEVQIENKVEANHETGGSYDEVIYCTECNAELSRVKVTTLPDEHTPGQATTENIVQAKCTVDGSYDEVIYCTECQAEISRIKKTIPALGHNFGDWSETAPKVDATCTTAGSSAVETHTCSRCNASETRGGEVINALGHDYTSVVTEATCTEQGYTTYTCSRCNDSYKADFTDAKGHTSGKAQEENRVEPGCTTNGSYDEVVYCTDCNSELSRIKITISALGHNFSDWSETVPKVDVTCTTAGSNAVEAHTCSRCNLTETRGGEVIYALNHDYASAVTAPTCTEQGYTTYTCSRCSDTYKSDFVDANGHTPAEPTEENRIDATYDDEGSYEEVIYCSVCNAQLSRKTVIIKKLKIPTTDSEFETEKIPFTEEDTSKPDNPSKPSTPTTKPKTKVKKPKATKIKKIKKGKKSFKVTWKKIKGVSGYQIQYSTNKKFKKKIKGKKYVVKKVSVKKAKTTKKTIKKLKANKKYYVRIRTYKVVKGKRVYSKWSKVKAVRTKK